MGNQQYGGQQQQYGQQQYGQQQQPVYVQGQQQQKKGGVGICGAVMAGCAAMCCLDMLC